MKIIVYGATKGVGQEVVKQGLERGHTVTAFVRDASHVKAQGSGLEVVEGDVFDPAAVDASISDQDAVVVTLGAHGFKSTSVRHVGTQNVIRAMTSHGVKRLVVLSTIGIAESAPLLPPVYKYVVFPLIIRNHVADHKRQEQVVQGSDRDWTIVRAAVLNNGPQTGEYKHGFAPSAKVDVKISRADVAHFILDQLPETTYLREAPSVSY